MEWGIDREKGGGSAREENVCMYEREISVALHSLVCLRFGQTLILRFI